MTTNDDYDRDDEKEKEKEIEQISEVKVEIKDRYDYYKD
jgi:hypothetical protein